MKRFLLLFFLFGMGCGDKTFHEHSSEAATPAVLEASAEQGFRLSPQAYQTLGIETVPLKNIAKAIPPSARVYFQDEVGVYRLREGWFRLIPLDAPDELRPDDAIVVQGAAFLRVTDMNLFGESSSGHQH